MNLSLRFGQFGHDVTVLTRVVDLHQGVHLSEQFPYRVVLDQS